MQEQMDPIEQPDRFSDYLRQRLEDHRMPLEDGGWEAINAQLTRRTTLRRRLLAAGLVAAAILAGLIWLIRPSDLPIPTDIAVQTTVDPPLPQQPSQPLVGEESSPALTVPVPSVPSRMLAVVSRPVAQTSVTDPIVLPEEAIETTDQPVAKETKEIKETPRPTDKRGEPTVPVDEKSLWKVNKDNVPAKRRSTASDRSSWLVAAGMGTGGNVSLGLGDYENPSGEMSNHPSPEGFS